MRPHVPGTSSAHVMGGWGGVGGSQTTSSRIRKLEDTDIGKAIGGKLAEPPATTQLPAPQKPEAMLQ